MGGQKKTEERKNCENLKFYVKEKGELKKELEAVMVSVAYMHVTVQYCWDSLFVTHPRTIWMKMVSLASYSGINFKVIVTRII